MTYSQLSLEERYFLSSLKAKGVFVPEIARALGRAPCTIYRELRRNERPMQGRYTPFEAHSHATARRRREQRGPHCPPECWDLVFELLDIQRSPEQTAHYLANSGLFSISFQTIYRRIRKNRRRSVTLYRDLRIMSKRRRKRYGSDDSRGILRGKRDISERPTLVNDRLEFGHWEADTVPSKDRHQCVLTLIERMTDAARLANRTASHATAAMARIISAEPDLFKTITFDNCTEFHSYRKLESLFPVTCYFANPHPPYSRFKEVEQEVEKV